MHLKITTLFYFNKNKVFMMLIIEIFHYHNINKLNTLFFGYWIFNEIFG